MEVGHEVSSSIIDAIGVFHRIGAAGAELDRALNTARGGPAVAVGPDLRIYAMGGYDEPGSTDLTSIEVFDGTQWTYVSEQTTLPSPRRAVTGIDGNIYAFSAAPANWSTFDGTTWTPLGPITPSDTNGDYDAVAGADGMLYLLGVGAGSPAEC